MNIIEKSATVLAIAAKGDPVITTTVVILFALLVNLLCSSIEVLITGGWVKYVCDVALLVAAIAYAAYAGYQCATFNSGLSKMVRKEVGA
jgi:hypothetical protein